MKHLIVPIAIIVGLIVFFLFVDRREFGRNDVVQTVQNERRTTDRKPTVSVPEIKPGNESKSATEIKPVGTNLVTEAPAEEKPVPETKQAKAQPASNENIDRQTDRQTDR